MYREDKATAMAVRFLQLAPRHKLNDLMLMKLMVIAERECMAQTTSLITGAHFASMQNGPVLSEVLDSMKRKTPSYFWNHFVGFVEWGGQGTASNHCVLKNDLDVTEYLSEFETELLGNVWKEHKRKTKWELVDITHTFPEWDKTCAETKSSSPIPYESVFEKGLHESSEVARERAQEIEYFESVAA